MEGTTQQSDREALAGPVSPEIQSMMDAGVFYGTTRTKTHPRMKRFVAVNRNEIEIIDLEKTLEMMKRAADAVSERARGGGGILFLGTQPHAQDGVREIAETFGFPYVTTRWLGGTLTNYQVISKRIEWYEKLKKDKALGTFENYTKKEQLDIAKQIEKLQGTLGGFEKMVGRPALIVIIDPVVHHTALREARRIKIPIVAFATTNADPDEIDYLVVGNTKARSSVLWFLGRLREAIERGRREAKTAAEGIVVGEPANPEKSESEKTARNASEEKEEK